MPIEIRELIIKATIKDESEKPSTSAPSQKADASNEEQIIQRCVEQIIEILRLKNER